MITPSLPRRSVHPPAAGLRDRCVEVVCGASDSLFEIFLGANRRLVRYDHPDSVAALPHNTDESWRATCLQTRWLVAEIDACNGYRWVVLLASVLFMLDEGCCVDTDFGRGIADADGRSLVAGLVSTEE